MSPSWYPKTDEQVISWWRERGKEMGKTDKMNFIQDIKEQLEKRNWPINLDTISTIYWNIINFLEEFISPQLSSMMISIQRQIMEMILKSKRLSGNTKKILAESRDAFYESYFEALIPLLKEKFNLEEEANQTNIL